MISIILSLNVLFYFFNTGYLFSCHSVEHFLISKRFDELYVLVFFFKIFPLFEIDLFHNTIKPLKFYVDTIICSLNLLNKYNSFSNLLIKLMSFKCRDMLTMSYT